MRCVAPASQSSTHRHNHDQKEVTMKTTSSNTQLHGNDAVTGAADNLGVVRRTSLLLLLLCLFSGLLFAKPVGSQSFNWSGAAPTGTKIRITAKAPPKPG